MRALVPVTVALLALPGVARAADSATARNSVGVLVVGDDAGEVGLVQRQLESPLAGVARLRVVGAAELAAELGVDAAETPPAMTDEIRNQLATLRERTADAYANGRYDDASTAVETLVALIQAYPRTAATEKVNAYLWRAAVSLAQDDASRAQAAALQALTLSPQLIVDAVMFPPSVVDLVNDTRAQLKMAELRLVGLPPGAAVTLDERPLALPARVPTGRHTLKVIARGFVPVRRDVEITADTEIEIAMPISLDEDTRRLVGVVARSGSVAATDEPALRELGLRTGVDVWLLAVAEHRGLRGVLWWAKGPDPTASTLLATSEEGRASLVVWATSTLSGAIDRRVKKAQRKRYWSIDFGWTTTQRARTLTTVEAVGQDDAGFRSAFWGGGPQVVFEVGYKRFLGEIAVAVVGYFPTTFTAPDGTEYVVAGGTSTTSYARVYYNHVFRARGEPIIALRLGIGTFVDNHVIDDLSDATGPLGIFPTTFYSGSGLVAGIRFWVPRVSGLQLDLLGGATPVGNITETPNGASGTEPRQRLTSVWTASMRYRINPRWSISGDFRQQRRELQFSGVAMGPFDPPIERATHLTIVNATSIMLRRTF